MLKKTSYEEAETDNVKPSKEQSPTVVDTDAIEAAKNEDMPLDESKHVSVLGST